VRARKTHAVEREQKGIDADELIAAANDIIAMLETQ
jgi:hypothetical protein